MVCSSRFPGASTLPCLGALLPVASSNISLSQGATSFFLGCSLFFLCNLLQISPLAASEELICPLFSV